MLIFMGIFRFRIVRLLFYIVCFSISISAMGHNDIYSVDSYKNILDIRYTPYSNDYLRAAFLIPVPGSVLPCRLRITG